MGLKIGSFGGLRRLWRKTNGPTKLGCPQNHLLAGPLLAYWSMEAAQGNHIWRPHPSCRSEKTHRKLRTLFEPTVDGRNPAPPKRPWRDDSPANTNKRYGFNHGFQLVRNGFRNHPQYHRVPVTGEGSPRFETQKAPQKSFLYFSTWDCPQIC